MALIGVSLVGQHLDFWQKKEMLKKRALEQRRRAANEVCAGVTKKKKEHVCELINLGKKNKYLFFYGYTGRYFISRVGMSYIYDVPKNKRGNLKKFKGKTIRIICIASGRNFCRSYMAGII